jgi:hypothetical protein
VTFSFILRSNSALKIFNTDCFFSHWSRTILELLQLFLLVLFARRQVKCTTAGMIIKKLTHADTKHYAVNYAINILAAKARDGLNDLRSELLGSWTMFIVRNSK